MTRRKRPGDDAALKELIYDFPSDPASHRGPRFWLKPANIAAARRVARADNSNRWRYAFYRGMPIDQVRTRPFSALLKGRPLSQPRADGSLFRFIIIADTGEGDRSQYALLPAIHALDPDFMIVNGDIAYPAGRLEDFQYGFFGPYAGLDIPIWAVPGNHEYYSPSDGEEFFEIFCTRKHEELWHSHRLRLVPQPGTYWALREGGDAVAGATGRPLPFMVIGIDTGHAGNLDGFSKKRFGFLTIPFTGRRRFENEDFEQHSWLETRLQEADRFNTRVIVLFHIPALVDTERKKDIHLDTLHQILASHPSVRLVVCGHIHNYQRYGQVTFNHFLATEFKRAPVSNAHYIVAGAGGAALSATDFKTGDYPARVLFPTPAAWRKHAGQVRQAFAKLGLGRTVIDHVADVVDRSAPLDDDPVEFGCLLVVDVKPDQAEVRPLLIEDLSMLYPDLPARSVVALADKQFQLGEKELERCLTIDTEAPIVIPFT